MLFYFITHTINKATTLVKFMLPHVKPTIRPILVRLIIGIKHDEISFRNMDGWIGGRVGCKLM